jgi:hypothetical protein
MRKYIRFISFFLIIVFISGAGLFADTLRIDNPKIKVKVVPGQTVTGAIGIENLSSENMTIRTYLEDFRYLDPFDGTKEFIAPGVVDNSCSEWISFSPQEFVLPAFGKKQVFYSVNVPQGASGGYYSVLFMESHIGFTQDSQGKQVMVMGRIGSLFFIETQDSLKRVQVTRLDSSGNRIYGSIKNAGNVILIAKPVFYVMDEAGLVADRGKLAEAFLNPGDETSFSLDISESLAPGRYIAVITFDLEDQDVEIKEAVFSKDSFSGIRILEIR